jgi:hypothetical protein
MIRSSAPLFCSRLLSARRSSAHVRSFSTLLDRARRQQALAVERQQRVNGDDYFLRNNNDADFDPTMAIFDDIDLNGDGVISREEFRIAIEKMRHLDLEKMKRSLLTNDISFNHKASVLGRKVIVSEAFNSWQFIKALPEYKYVSHLCPPVALPPKEPGAPDLTLVLDMDETILHCSVEEPTDENPPCHSFKVSHQGKSFPVHAWLRPGLQDFFEKICGKFEVVIFTASQAPYANAILDIIDPGKKKFNVTYLPLSNQFVCMESVSQLSLCSPFV